MLCCYHDNVAAGAALVPHHGGDNVSKPQLLFISKEGRRNQQWGKQTFSWLVASASDKHNEERLSISIHFDKHNHRAVVFDSHETRRRRCIGPCHLCRHIKRFPRRDLQSSAPPLSTTTIGPSCYRLLCFCWTLRFEEPIKSASTAMGDCVTPEQHKHLNYRVDKSPPRQRYWHTTKSHWV